MLETMRIGLIVKKLVLIFLFLVTVLSAAGCSVLKNSERFYRDHPLTDIYFHEYNDD